MSDAPELAVEDSPLIIQPPVTLSCPTGFGEPLLPAAPLPGTLPFIPLTSLKAVENPVIPKGPTGAPLLRGDLAKYVLDLKSAIQLGKALFWDIQAGSDNLTSCASCHFQAGADVREKNQLHPGANVAWDGLSANYAFQADGADFPFVDFAIPRDVDNVAGSQGVRASTFVGVTDAGVELTTPRSDAVYGTMRQVTGVNTPPVVNAVFNHRNFFNGRAQPDFNGVNPWGARQITRVWYVSDTLGNVAQIDVRIPNASLASQAVGPPLNPVEMSAAGRTFPELGKKMLKLKPLGLQKVAATDSVLGPVADPNLGLTTATYAALVQKAFQPKWWNTPKTVLVNGKSYTLMQANFAMFWGLAIMLYEGTLVADDSPMDRYVASRVFDLTTGNLTSHNPALLDPVVNRLAAQGITIPLADGTSRAVTRADILLGLDLFEKPLPLPGAVGTPPGTGVGCAFCHVGAETTSASVQHLTNPIEPGDIALRMSGYDLRMERMFMGIRTPPQPAPPGLPPPVPAGTNTIVFDFANYTVTSMNGVAVAPSAAPIKVYDTGWYNLGVRPTADDLGIGGKDAFNRPLSWVEYFQTIYFDPSNIKVVGAGLGCADALGNPISPPAAPVTSPFAGEVLNPATNVPLLSGGLRKTEATDVAGSFKTMGLRNVELNAPYFHTGGKATLRQVVEFYDDGGNFDNPTKSPLMRPLAMNEEQINALIAFLLSLTDERVLYQRAPFDHPALPVPAGQDAGGADIVATLPAVGASGSAALPRFLGLNPFAP